MDTEVVSVDHAPDSVWSDDGSPDCKSLQCFPFFHPSEYLSAIPESDVLKLPYVSSPSSAPCFDSVSSSLSGSPRFCLDVSPRPAPLLSPTDCHYLHDVLQPLSYAGLSPSPPLFEQGSSSETSSNWDPVLPVPRGELTENPEAPGLLSASNSDPVLPVPDDEYTENPGVPGLRSASSSDPVLPVPDHESTDSAITHLVSPENVYGQASPLSDSSFRGTLDHLQSPGFPGVVQHLGSTSDSPAHRITLCNSGCSCLEGSSSCRCCSVPSAPAAQARSDAEAGVDHRSDTVRNGSSQKVSRGVKVRVKPSLPSDPPGKQQQRPAARAGAKRQLLVLTVSSQHLALIRQGAIAVTVRASDSNDGGSFLVPEQKQYEPESVPDFYSDEWLVPLENLPAVPSESPSQSPHLQQHPLPDDLQDLVLDDETLASLPLQSANSILDDLILSTAESDTSASPDFSPQPQLPLLGDACLSDTCVNTGSPCDELRDHCSSLASALSEPAPAKRRRPTPYSRGAAASGDKNSLCDEERRERKRHQNKLAATRYRQKKRHELSVVAVDESQLERKNRQLKDHVVSLTKEVDYLRQLMRQVFENKPVSHSAQLRTGHSALPLTLIS